MSLKDKAAKIDFGALEGGATANPSTDSGQGMRPKTAPGMMMAHAADQRSELLRENDALKASMVELKDAVGRAAELQHELKSWDGAKATRLIDPMLIARSEYANRDERHFQSAKFQEFKGEIASSGGNVQPIKVRPVVGGGEGGQHYELVFGHRRLEACRQLGLPVLALVDNLDDRGLLVEMERENRGKEDLSAWEQGMMYRRALAKGLFPSSRQLALALGCDLTNVGRALALADLPAEVVDAFPSPLDLQFRWARPLADAWGADPVGLRRCAQEMIKAVPRPSAKAVFERLIAAAGQRGSTVLPPQSLEVEVGGNRAAVIAINRKGATSVTIEPGLVVQSELKALAKLVQQFLTKAK